MKSMIPLQQFKKCIILFVVGVICSTLSYMICAINPLRMMIESTLEMSPGSMVFQMWKKPPIEVYIKLYVFNITNPEEFLHGGEKLKVEEVGPYVYREILENHNISWHDNGTISYIPKRTIVHVPEMSVGNPEVDLVSVPNIPMLGISSALHDAGFLLNYPWARLVSMLNSKPILNLTVHDYLWGYEDSLVELASSIVPNFINFKKFGLLDRMYDEGENTIFMNIRKNKNMTEETGRYLSIDMYNGSPGLPHWGYEEQEGNETHPENTICNRIRGATEGTLFPSYIDEHAMFRVYRKAFCRAIPIKFQKKVWMNDTGIEGYLYDMADDFMEPPDVNPDNKCYCRKLKKCLKKGLSNMTPCYYNIPTALSLPHFLKADPSLLEDVDGLNPDPEKHRARIIIQPYKVDGKNFKEESLKSRRFMLRLTLPNPRSMNHEIRPSLSQTVGVPMAVNSRLQMNLIMYHTTYNSKIEPFNDKTIPLFWTDLFIPSLPNDLIFLVKLTVQILPIAQTVLMCLLGIIGVTTIILSLSATLWVFNQQQEKHVADRRDSTDLRIPLSCGQYTSIRILPTIKNITSKTDLFS